MFKEFLEKANIKIKEADGEVANQGTSTDLGMIPTVGLGVVATNYQSPLDMGDSCPTCARPLYNGQCFYCQAHDRTSMPEDREAMKEELGQDTGYSLIKPFVNKIAKLPTDSNKSNAIYEFIDGVGSDKVIGAMFRKACNNRFGNSFHENKKPVNEAISFYAVTSKMEKLLTSFGLDNNQKLQVMQMVEVEYRGLVVDDLIGLVLKQADTLVHFVKAYK